MDIKDIFNINQELYTTDKLIELVTETYTNFFIDNYSMWKEKLNQLNLTIDNKLKESNIRTYLPITFDDFIKIYLDKITNHIKINKSLKPFDVLNIVYDISSEIYKKEIDKSIEHNKKLVSIINSLNQLEEENEL